MADQNLSLQAESVPDDAVLFQAFCNDNDKRAFETLVVRYHERVLRLAYKMARDNIDAQEIAQEVFITVFKKAKFFRFQASFSSWLYRITFNLSLMHLRKRKGKLQSVTTNFGLQNDLLYLKNLLIPDQQADIFNKNDLHKLIFNALETLQPEYKQVFYLRDIYGQPAKEVSELLKISLPSLKSRLHRARSIVRKILLQHLSYEQLLQLAA